MPDPIREFHRANAAGNAALFTRAHNAGLVLGYFDCFPGYGLQPGDWKDGSEYPPEFLTMCSEACVSPKRIVRDIKAYDYYGRLRGWCVDAPGWLVDNSLHPRELRRKGITLGHFSEVRELGERYDFGPHQALDYLASAVEAGMGATALRNFIREEQESENGEVEPLPRVWARSIHKRLKDLADTEYDNHPRVRAWAREGLRLLGETWGL